MTRFDSLQPSEHEIQTTFAQSVLIEYRLDSTFVPALFYAVLNGPYITDFDGDKKRKDGLIRKYQEEGWRPGIADFHYDQPRGRFNKLVFEFKKEDKRKTKNGGLSDEQIVYLTAMQPYAFVRVIYTVDEAMEHFKRYMEMPILGPSPIAMAYDTEMIGQLQKFSWKKDEHK